MEKYVFLITLLFNLSIVGTLLLLQITHRAARHPMIWIEVVTLVLLIYEVGREMFTLFVSLNPHLFRGEVGKLDKIVELSL